MGPFRSETDETFFWFKLFFLLYLFIFLVLFYKEIFYESPSWCTVAV